MPFLTINGVTVNVVESRRDPYRVGGGLDRADNGSVRSMSGASYFDYRFQTGPLSPSYAATLRMLVDGLGHALNFSSTTHPFSWRWTSRGLAPYYAPNASLIATGGKWGASYMRVSSSDTAVWAALPDATGPWTCLMWRRGTTGSGTWEHYTCRSDGSVFVGGVLNGSLVSTTFVRRDTSVLGGIALRGSAVPSGADFDDVVFLPYAVPDAWVPMMYALHSAQAWPSLPFVTVGGDFIGSSRKMRGEVGTTETVNGAFGTFGESFDFVLMESP